MGAYFIQMKSFTSAWGGQNIQYSMYNTRPRHITLTMQTFPPSHLSHKTTKIQHTTQLTKE